MRIDRQWIGPAIVAAFFLAIFGLLLNAWVIQLASVACFVMVFYSDVDEDNHVDPAGVPYMDRNGDMARGPEGEAV